MAVILFHDTEADTAVLMPASTTAIVSFTVSRLWRLGRKARRIATISQPMDDPDRISCWAETMEVAMDFGSRKPLEGRMCGAVAPSWLGDVENRCCSPEFGRFSASQWDFAVKFTPKGSRICDMTE